MKQEILKVLEKFAAEQTSLQSEKGREELAHALCVVLGLSTDDKAVRRCF
tara:strand:+ start:1215 stop:1364 length:150 start_codon:yes stop_codon:yes gene_type:complete